MKFIHNKKVYIVASVFGLSLIIAVPILAVADSIKYRHMGMMWPMGHMPQNLVAGDFVQSAGLRKLDGQPMMARGFFGSIDSVSGSSFNLSSVKKNATTTFTINTDSSATFKKDGVAGTFSSLVAGQYVVVMGTLATSTKTILAKSVNIITHPPTQNSLQHVFRKTR